jgi:hypothetical protein
MFLQTRIDGKRAAVLVLMVITLSAGLALMSWQIRVRTRRAVTEGHSAAAEIWGAQVSQQSPSVVDSRDPQVRLPLVGVNGTVDIDMDYRRRGLVYLTGFRAAFTTTYKFRNDAAVSVPADFFLPLPAGGELFTGVKVNEVVPGAGSSSYDATGIHWAGTLQPGETRELETVFQTRGLDNYVYHIPSSPGLEKFAFAVTVDRGADVDYPISTVAPTARESGRGETRLTWDLDNVVSAFDVGVALPEHPDYARDLVRLNLFAPLLLVGMLILFSVVLYLKGYLLDIPALCLTALGFFIVFPLVSYLVSFMGIVPAYTIAACAGGGLLLFFVARRFGSDVYLGSILAVALFLGVFPVALLADRYTGLVITIGAFVLIAAVMELYLSRDRMAMPAEALEGAGR